MGATFYSSILYLAPCTYITAHTHPSTHEFNVVSQGKLTWSMYPQVRRSMKRERERG